MKYITISIAFLVSVSLMGQEGELTNDNLSKQINALRASIQSLQKENKNFKNEILILNSKLTTSGNAIDSLQTQIDSNNKILKETASQLGLKISNTEIKANEKIKQVDQSISKTSLYSIIGVLLAIIISGVIYMLLRKKQKTDKSDMIDQLSKTKSTIEESLIKEFGKQNELLNNQFLLIEQQHSAVKTNPNAELDHTLAISMANQINVIERNLAQMDSKTKGLKQIQSSIGKQKDNLLAKGYEMPELLGKQFHQGMKVFVTSSIADENLEKDSEIISKVLIPQVNYNDKMIQTAQIETSKGY